MGIAFGLGVIFGARAVLGSTTTILPVIVLLLASAIVTRTGTRNLCLLAALGCLFGAGAGLLTRSETDVPILAEQPSGLIVGTIRSDVQITPRGGIADFRWNDQAGAARNSTVFLPPAPVVGRGDTIAIEASVDGAYGEDVFASAIRIIERAGWIEQRRRSIRSYLSDTIHEHVPGTPGALTLGLLIGDDTALTGDERDDMRRAGLSHLTAVSGWNVTLVIGAVGLVMLRVGLRGWIWTTLQLLALAGFVWVVGLEPPVTRAAIMAVAGIIAIRLGRPAHSVTVLVISAAVMVAVSPDALTSISFQLSVLATLGLVLAARLTSGYDGWKAAVLTPLAATSIAGLMTAPTLAAEFGTLTLLTIPANLIAGPLVPIASVAGIIVVVLSPIPPLAAVAGWFAWLLSGMLLWLARQIAAVPYAYHSFAPLSDAAQAALYAAMLTLVLMLLPEGRLLARNAANWAQREPIGATVTAGTACLALLTAALAV